MMSVGASVHYGSNQSVNAIKKKSQKITEAERDF